MKKEIWKLLELLNEYQNKYIPDYPIRASEETINSGREILISKRYWFIKWLVENDKIDFDNRDLKDRFMNEFERYPQFQNNTINREFNVNGLLMLLSISDIPIEDLISYLK